MEKPIVKIKLLPGGENAVMHLFEMEDIENENC